MNSLLRAKLEEQVSLAICLRYLAVGTFLFFSACWTKLATRTNTCCTTSPASLSPVLRLFLAYCHPNLCTLPFLCPSFGQRFLNVMLQCSIALVPPVTPSWIVAQVTKHTRNSLLASWTDLTTPLKSVLDSTKCWCAGNLAGKVETFATLTIAPKTGSMKHLSPRRHTSLPVLTTTFLLSNNGKPPSQVSNYMGLLRTCGIGFNLIVVFWCHNSGSRKFGRLRGCPFGAAACVQGCARLPMAMCALLQHHLLVPVQHYQDDHHCVEPSYSVAQAWTFIKHFYDLLGPKLATPGGDKFSVTQPSLPFAWHQGLPHRFTA